jgi:hypothetical protein
MNAPTRKRERLPNRRSCETFEIRAALHLHCTASRYSDGRLGEVFITNHKAGSSAAIMASDAAIAASLALQHGCPLGAALDRLADEEAAP